MVVALLVDWKNVCSEVVKSHCELRPVGHVLDTVTAAICRVRVHEVFVFERADMPDNCLAGYVESLGEVSCSEPFIMCL